MVTAGESAAPLGCIWGENEEIFERKAEWGAESGFDSLFDRWWDFQKSPDLGEAVTRFSPNSVYAGKKEQGSI